MRIPGQEQTAPRGQNFDVNRKALSLYPVVANFKEISLKSNKIKLRLYTFFFHDLIHVFSPRASSIQPPRGRSFDGNRNFLSLWSFGASYKSLMTIVSEKSIVFPFSLTKA